MIQTPFFGTVDLSLTRAILALQEAGLDGGYGEFDPLYEAFIAKQLEIDVFKFRARYEFEVSEDGTAYQVNRKEYANLSEVDKNIARNWRYAASLPEHITDVQIMEVVKDNDLYYGTSQANQENQDAFDLLRRELGLEVE